MTPLRKRMIEDMPAWRQTQEASRLRTKNPGNLSVCGLLRRSGFTTN